MFRLLITTSTITMCWPTQGSLQLPWLAPLQVNPVTGRHLNIFALVLNGDGISLSVI